MKKRFMSLTLVAALLATALTGCSSSSSDADTDTDDTGDTGTTVTETIRIGAIGPTTGGAAVYGNAVKNGAMLAIEEINAMGGLQFELNFQDDEHDAEKAVSAYNTLKDWDMQVLMGTVTTGPALAVGPEANADSVFMLTPSASATDVTEGYDNVFQLCFNDPNQGTACAQYINDNALSTSVAIIYNNSDAYSTGIYETFMEAAAGMNFEVVSVTTFTDDSSSDFSVQLSAAKSAGADLVFIPVYVEQASLMMSQANSMEYAPTFFGCDGLDGILSLEGFDTSLAEGAMLLTPFAADATDDATVSFVTKYEEAYGETPNQFAADGYDCIYAIAQACEAAGVTSTMDASEVCELLVEQFTTMTFDGLTGAGMTWASTGEVSKDPQAVVIQDGAYVGM